VIIELQQSFSISYSSQRWRQTRYNKRNTNTRFIQCLTKSFY